MLTSHFSQTYGNFSRYFVPFLWEVCRQKDLFCVENRSTIDSAVLAMTDRLKELNVTAMQSHAILILKADICKAYMSIHPHRTTTSSLFKQAWFIRCFVGYWVCDTNMTYYIIFQNPNPSTRSLRRWAFIFIVLLEVWNYIQFNMFVTILLYHCVKSVRVRSYSGRYF